MNENLLDEVSTQHQYLLFYVGGVLYAIEALKAQEIVEYGDVTKVPKMNLYVDGVTNIRGNIVPVVDLVSRFNLGKTVVGDKTSIIVINYDKNNEKMQVGIVIDEVYEVDSIEPSDIKKAPDFGANIESRFIKYMGKYEDEYIEILDTDAILNIEELSELVD